jgi:hypothetical protein
LVTTTTAMARLGRGRAQVLRLIEAGLLPVTGQHGRARLLDPAALDELADRPVLLDVGNPADTPVPTAAVPYALALHLGPRVEDGNRFNGRAWQGWEAAVHNRDDAWTGWWNTGERIADACVAAALPVLPAVSGVVVDVRVIRGWIPHPVYPGLVQFQVSPAPEQLRERYAGSVFRPAPGPPWQRLWRPSGQEELAVASPAESDNDHGEHRPE